MPISEDEFDSHIHGQNNIQGTMSKAELRRSNKPIMEKRRRARINHCLNELKTLILDAMKKDPARHSKLEKADILEMTVKHLQNIQRQQLAVAVATDPTVLHKFKTGFSECATEVNRYIHNMDAVENGVKQRLAVHLNGCVTGLQQPPMSFPVGQSSTIPLTISQSSSGVSIQTGNLGDLNNNQNARVQVPAGIQLIPSRLPTGELALLVPNGSNLPFFSNTMLGTTNYPSSTENIQRNLSAFTSVRPKPSETYKMKMSPPLSPASSTNSYQEESQDISRPRTPAPKEISISYPTPPGPSAFKPNKDVSPPQQFQVTSTSISPENKPVKIEHKSVPIYQHDKQGPFRHKSMEPLSVITERKSHVEYNRKRVHPDGLLAVADQPSTSKQGRYSDETSSMISSSSGSPDGPFHKPSTSHNVESHDSMWRPW